MLSYRMEGKEALLSCAILGLKVPAALSLVGLTIGYDLGAGVGRFARLTAFLAVWIRASLFFCALQYIFTRFLIFGVTASA
jgi:hypothetical protein